MKKLLAILASITLVSSSSAVVVSCGTSTSQIPGDKYLNNNLNDIVEASLEKAKSVIINNEYGIDQNVVKNRQLQVDQKAAKLINQYYGSATASNDSIKSGSNIDLSGTNGVDDGITYLLKGLFTKLNLNPIISNGLLNGKNLLVNLLTNLTPITSQLLDQYNHSLFNTAISGIAFTGKAALNFGINYLNNNNSNGAIAAVISAINWILTQKDTLANSTLPGIFGAGDDKNTTINQIRAVIMGAMDKGTTQTKIQDAVYQNTDLEIPKLSIDAPTTENPEPKWDKSKTIKVGLSSVTLNGKSYTPDKIADIKFSDVKKEIFASVDRLLNAAFTPSAPDSDQAKAVAALFKDFKPVLGGPADDKYLSAATNDLEEKLAYIITGLATKKITGDQISAAFSGFTQEFIMRIILEGLRIVTIMNAQFSILESTNDYEPKDAKHLFDADLDNYQWLNQKVDDKQAFLNKTLGESDYVGTKDAQGKDREPISINYLIHNLNYYLGGLRNRDESSYYKIQKFMFVVMNDPSTIVNNSGNETWFDKQSDIIDFITNVGYAFLKQFVDPTSKAGQAIAQIKPDDLESVKTLILKPLILGLINGDSMGPLIKGAVGAFEGAVASGLLPQSVLDDLKAIGIDLKEVENALNALAMDSKFTNDTFNSLFTDDFGSIVRPLSFIPEKYMDELFGPNLPVNLGTIADFTLAKILSILNVPGFVGGKISPIGDWYTTHSIPWLIDKLDRGLNTTDQTLLQKYVVKNKAGVIDWTKSLMSRDFNVSATYDLLISIIGKAYDQSKPYKFNENKYDDQYNIFTKLLDDLIVVTPPDKDAKTIPLLDLKPEDLVKDLGFAGQVNKTPSVPDKARQLDDTDGSDTPSGDDKPSDGGDTPGGDDKPDDGDKTPTFIKATYDQKTTITVDTKNITDVDVKSLKFDPDYGVTIKSASVSGDKLTITIDKPFVQIESEQAIRIIYTTKDKQTVSAYFIVNALNKGEGMDLQYRVSSLYGALNRLSLPEIDFNKFGTDDYAGEIFTMNDKYFEQDVLGSDWESITRFINHMNDASTQYVNFIDQIIDNDRTFEIYYDDKDIKYFRNNRKLIKGFTFRITYKNYVVGQTNDYLFTVSRNSNLNAFKIVDLYTNKTNA